MAFSPQFLDELRARIDLAGLIGKRVRLQKRGREHLGLCPFHNEKTPSFTVNEDKGFYHCFGCGEHGSGIDFVMKLDNLSFPEAVERLAGEAGLEVPRTSPEERQRAERAKSHYVILEAAAAHFEKQLRLPVGEPARDYLQARGITEASIRRFRLGFAPNTRDGLKSGLARDGIKGGALVESGLLIEPDEADRPAYDRFRGRVMFPITDLRGRVIAFGGRILGEGEPKYLNSPETPLFQKRRNLYGLTQAAEGARAKQTIVVVEGYTDVIGLDQAGFNNAVAPLGTALTEDQVRILWRYAPEPTLCFDGDAAGARAAARAAENMLPILRPGHGLRFANLPAGQDPDSLVRGGGPEAMQRVLDEALPLSEMIWRMERRGRRLDIPEGRAGLEARLRELTGRIQDEVVRRHYFTSLKDRIWQEIRQQRDQGRGAKSVRGPAPRQMAARSGVTAHVDTIRLQEEILITTVITHPALFDRVDETLGTLSFSSPELDKLRQEVLNTLSGAPDLDFEGLADHLRSTGLRDTLGGLLSRRVYNHARFARPDQPLTDAEKGWEQLYRLYRRTQLLEEISAAEARLKAEPTREAFEVLKALKASASTIDEDAGPTETMRRTAGDGAA
jgi:DNA primase